MPTLKIQKADGSFDFLQLAGEEFADIGNQVLDVKSQLAHTEQDLKTRTINANFPPAPLQGIFANGVNADNERLQVIIDFAEQNGIKAVIMSGIPVIEDTVELGQGMILKGLGRFITYVQGKTGDKPVFSRRNYTNRNVSGGNRIKLKEMTIEDHATDRQNHYTVDFTNGHSCELIDVEIVATGSTKGVTPLNAKYGAILGKAFNSTYSEPCFLARAINSRFNKAKLVINTTDWYIINTEVWGNERDFAVMITGGGFIGNGTQLVGGETYGALTLYHESNWNIETLKVQGVFFDGSYDSINSGAGITSYEGYTGALVHSVINGCTFWMQNRNGIWLNKAHGNDISGNTFNDCDSDDTGESDIFIGSGWGNTIDNKHYRSATTPKLPGKPNRVNKAPAINLTTVADFPYSTVNGSVAWDSSYINANYNGKEVQVLSSSPRLYHTKTANPSFNAYRGIFDVNGNIFYNTPTSTVRLNQPTTDANSLSSGDCNTFVTSQNIYMSNMGSWTNKPSAVTTGICLLKVFFVATNFCIQELYSFDNNAIYRRRLNNGTWTAWQ